MGQLLEKPNTEKQTFSGQGPDGLKYGFAAMQGWRIDMEDAHALLPDVGGDQIPGWSFFAIFDGHAGDRVSKHSAQHLWTHVLEHLPSASTTLTNNNQDKFQLKVICDALKKAFYDLDIQLRELPDIRNGLDKSGSTAVGCLITNQHLLFVNVGDSRAIFIKDNSVSITTIDHKPSNDKERRRIIEAGGMVIIQRVNGSLAVSRALGDFEYKADPDRAPESQLVSPEADIYAIDRDVRKDQALVLACDGIWDVMTNDDVCLFVTSRLKQSRDPMSICSDLLDTCLTKGSKDNMSVIIVVFPAGYGTSSTATVGSIVKSDSKIKDTPLSASNPALVDRAYSASNEANVDESITNRIDIDEHRVAKSLVANGNVNNNFEDIFDAAKQSLDELVQLTTNNYSSSECDQSTNAADNHRNSRLSP